MRPLSRQEVRSLDRLAIDAYGIPSLVLMENAGRGAAEWLAPHVPNGGRVLILAGPGNNGGDGGVVARHLDLRGLDVTIRWIANPTRLSPDAATQWTILDRAGFDQAAWPDGGDPATLRTLIQNAAWVVDALLGTGLTRAVEEPLLTIIDAINASGHPVLALDLPSGLDADTGSPHGAAVRATATVTFVAPKLGFTQPGANAYTGNVVVAPIGVPRSLLRQLDPTC